MRPVTHQNLGVVLAYLVPGFLLLWSLSLYLPSVQGWLGAPAATAPSVGGFLYVTLMSLGLGVLANMLRALLLDPLHQRTGIAKRSWSYAALQENIAAVEFMIVHQFTYYQFCGNLLIAALLSYFAFELHGPGWSAWLFIFVVALEAVLWFGSRATLRTYYRRLEEILGSGEGERAPAARISEEPIQNESAPGSGSDPEDSVGSPAAA
jgi:hypothetical protein